MKTGFKIKIQGTFRGLTCFSAEKKMNSGRHIVFLWNPATRKHKTLPCSHGTYRDYQYHRGLALGYLPEIDDYKVIKFQSFECTVGEDDRDPTVCIYSLNTDSWKMVGKDIVSELSRYSKLYNSVIVNGVAYWVGIVRDPFMQVIVCFDIEKEKIQEIMFPPQYVLNVDMGHFCSFYLVQHFDEVLVSAVYMNCDANTRILDIFSLGKGDGEDVVCTNKVTIDLNKVGHTLWPLGFRCNGEIVLINYNHTEGGFLSYDHEKKIATKILDDSWELWSYAHLRVSDDGLSVVFEAGEEEHMQYMYVSSLAESLVLLGDKPS